MSENTKEQLKMGIYESSNDLANIETIDGRPFAELMYKDDAERVIECYNALAGIENPAALLAEVREAIAEAVKIAQRYETELRYEDYRYDKRAEAKEVKKIADRLAALAERLGGTK